MRKTPRWQRGDSGACGPLPTANPTAGGSAAAEPRGRAGFHAWAGAAPHPQPCEGGGGRRRRRPTPGSSLPPPHASLSPPSGLSAALAGPERAGGAGRRLSQHGRAMCILRNNSSCCAHDGEQRNARRRGLAGAGEEAALSADAGGGGRVSSSGASAAGGTRSLPGKGRGSPVEVFFAARRRKGAEISTSRGNLRVPPESQGQKRLRSAPPAPDALRCGAVCCAGFPTSLPLPPPRAGAAPRVAAAPQLGAPISFRCRLRPGPAGCQRPGHRARLRAAAVRLRRRCSPREGAVGVGDAALRSGGEMAPGAEGPLPRTLPRTTRSAPGAREHERL